MIFGGRIAVDSGRLSMAFASFFDHQKADELKVVQAFDAFVEKAHVPATEEAVQIALFFSFDHAFDGFLQEAGVAAHVFAVFRFPIKGLAQGFFRRILPLAKEAEGIQEFFGSRWWMKTSPSSVK